MTNYQTQTIYLSQYSNKWWNSFHNRWRSEEPFPTLCAGAGAVVWSATVSSFRFLTKTDMILSRPLCCAASNMILISGGHDA